MTLRNYLYIISTCVFSLSCFGMSHDEYPFATGNAGWVPEYIDEADATVGSISLVNTYDVEPIDYTSDYTDYTAATDYIAEEDIPMENGNAGYVPEQDEEMEITGYSDENKIGG